MGRNKVDPESAPRFSLVIPLYNEEDNVRDLLREIHEVLAEWDYEVVLVDDGSTDDTVARIEAHPRIRLLEFGRNTGQSAAMYAGIMASRGKWIGLMDGDLQNDPRDLEAMVAAVEDGADLVCGYRANRQDTAFKKFQSRVANAVRSRFTGDGVRDTGCTLKVMRRDCRDVLVPFRGMHRFIPAFFKSAGHRVVEVPVKHRQRQHGDSKYGGGLRRTIPATVDMFGVRWLNSRRFRIALKGGEAASGSRETGPSGARP